MKFDFTIYMNKPINIKRIMIGFIHFIHDESMLISNKEPNEKDNIEPIQPRIITIEKYATNLTIDNLGYIVLKNRLK